MRGITRQPTRRQIVLEREYGKSLAAIIDELLYDRDLTHERAAKRLGISPVTLWHWRRRLAEQAQSQPAESVA